MFFCTLFGGVFFALWSVHAYMESSIAWRTYFEYIRRRSAVLDHFNLCNLSQLRDKEWSLGLVPLSVCLSVCLPAPEPQIIGKTQRFATFLPFREHGSSFFGDFLFLIFFLILFSSLTLPISAFHLSTLSEV